MYKFHCEVVTGLSHACDQRRKSGFVIISIITTYLGKTCCQLFYLILGVIICIYLFPYLCLGSDRISSCRYSFYNFIILNKLYICTSERWQVLHYCYILNSSVHVYVLFQINREFLQCDDFLVADVHVDDQRHLVFATPAQLELLKNARRWFCDGTFKIVSRPFIQLWSVHAFIRKED